MSEQDLFAFDALARHAIDPALEAAANANENNPDYIVSVLPDYSASRRRCLLTIRNRDVRKDNRNASLAIIADIPKDMVRAQDSNAIIENGTPRVISTLKWEDVTYENITQLARKFVDDFFH